MKRLQSTARLKEVMAGHFRGLHEAQETGSKPIAWCTSVGPAELLRAMGFEVYFPENHGAMLGSSKVAAELIPAACTKGFSPEICSYTTSDIGAYLKGYNAFAKVVPKMKGPPKPDVLVYNTQQCVDVQRWFRFYADEFDVPMFGLTPPRYVSKLTDGLIAFVASEFQRLAEQLTPIAGAPLDIDALKETLRLSRDAAKLWRQCLEYGAHRPSPWTFFDGVIHMGPIVVMRGTQEAVDYYELLAAELKQRIKDGISAIEHEKLRFYWEGMPIWGRLRKLSELFASHNVAIVASTYCNSWIFDTLDPDDPFRSMAATYTSIFINRDDATKEQYLVKLSKDFSIDGMIFHDARTCSDNSNCRHGMQELMTEQHEIPTLVIYGDLNDLRCYSDERTRTDVEAFIEQLSEL